eukprot:scaffold26695_cov71-Cyclotella_meneghiniana.AAC.1
MHDRVIQERSFSIEQSPNIIQYGQSPSCTRLEPVVSSQTELQTAINQESGSIDVDTELSTVYLALLARVN